jgi:hypothetical protein
MSGMGPGPGMGTPGIGGGLMGNPGGGLGIMGSSLGGGGLGGSGLGGGIGGFSGMPGRGSNAKPGTNTPTEGMKQLGDPAQGASNKPGGPGMPGGAAKRDIKVIALQHASAVSLAKSLHELLNDGNTRIVAEQQTNSLMIQSDQGTYELVEKLVQRLDAPPRSRN